MNTIVLLHTTEKGELESVTLLSDQTDANIYSNAGTGGGGDYGAIVQMDCFFLNATLGSHLGLILFCFVYFYLLQSTQCH